MSSIDLAVTQRQSMTQQIRQEIDDLKAVAAAFGIERIRDGTWFNEFMRAMLASYATHIMAEGGIAFFRAKYPGLTRDQIAEKLCDLATRYAALAGGASGATASAAFAATIGTAGGAGIVAVPAGVTAIIAEMLYTTRLQVRLVYDLSMIYGYPIDLDDPEDLYRAFCMAYGIAFVSGNAGVVVKKATPELMRAHIRGLINGQTAAIQQVAMRLLGPRLGRQITQRAILRAAVPIASVGISATWNYVSTNAIASSARRSLRAIGKLRDAVQEVGAQLQTHADQAMLVVESLLAIITADEHFDAYEQEVFTTVLSYLDLPPDVLPRIEERTTINPETIEAQLRTVTDPSLRRAILRCLELVTVADGHVLDSEMSLLQQFAAALAQPVNSARLMEQAQLFQGTSSWTQQAGESLSALRETVGSTVSGWFSKRRRNAAVEEETEANSSSEDQSLTAIRHLATLYAEGIITPTEFEAKKHELLARL